MFDLKNIASLTESTHPKLAYFSMEIALENNIPTYSGGLGVLAGDTLKAAADLKLPMVAVSLLYKKGFFEQKVLNGNQTESDVEWEPKEHMELLPDQIELRVEGRIVNIQARKYEIKSPSGGVLPVYFLDTDIVGNSDEDRQLTAHLYGGDRRYRLIQELILGVGGVRILASFGFDKIEKFHMNEGHASLLTLELLRDTDGEDQIVKDVCVFTTHTPVAAGHDKFDYGLVESVLDQEQFSIDKIKKYAGQDELNTTVLALNLSGFANAVAKKHSVISRNMFPGYNIKAITNGVHSNTWTCDEFAKVYDKYLEDWRIDPFNLRNAIVIPSQEVWEAHTKAKRKLFDYVKEKVNVQMDENIFTIGFARRATGYKRAHLVFNDLERLKEVVRNAGNIQLIFAGKAHPNDTQGKEEIKRICDIAAELGNEIKIVFLEGYDMEISKMLVSGVDVWLNTPVRPREA